MTARLLRGTAALVTTAVVASLTAACDYRGASSLPLPGGEGGGGYTVTAVFDDVTNLVPKETCRAGDVVVGSVESVELRKDLRATVVCRIDKDVHLAGNAVATLRETSLLGERFVALDPPDGQRARGTLAHGAVLDENDTHVVPDAEIVLGALSQVLNGGGLGNIETISRELTTALSRSDLGGTTREIGRLVATLDEHRDDLVAALTAIERLSGELRDQRQAIGSALDSVPQGLAVLDRQRPALVRTVESLGELSQVAVPLIRDSKEATVEDLRNLGPILEQLARSKHRLARAVEAIGTYPFPSYFKFVARGDYAGMFATINLDVDSLNTLLREKQQDGRGLPKAGTGLPVPGLPALPELPDLPALPGLPQDLLGGGRGSSGQLDGEDPDLGFLPLGRQVRARYNPVPPASLADLLTGGES
ncbi:MCE family protein [Nocardioides marmoribigeumensis]|uniref:Phospholipid/cholesterol/gamma-HCH transport system substrate-binding protein n=1 Tax=Nocardioides marmoribigeumensis TaxID=433649 RepID=A0ABU2BVA7_9ACTN|nr:MCE family protein [Nocardioides marmoribigeumensis]MDR7362567.1 phospholipid/cholesterol/gamma-HCH transport system substrate-binding protein [Nocardioides marmoribigeumensis]